MLLEAKRFFGEEFCVLFVRRGMGMKLKTKDSTIQLVSIITVLKLRLRDFRVSGTHPLKEICISTSVVTLPIPRLALIPT